MRLAGCLCLHLLVHDCSLKKIVARGARVEVKVLEERVVWGNTNWFPACLAGTHSLNPLSHGIDVLKQLRGPLGIDLHALDAVLVVGGHGWDVKNSMIRFSAKLEPEMRSGPGSYAIDIRDVWQARVMRAPLPQVPSVLMIRHQLS